LDHQTLNELSDEKRSWIAQAADCVFNYLAKKKIEPLVQELRGTKPLDLLVPTIACFERSLAAELPSGTEPLRARATELLLALRFAEFVHAKVLSNAADVARSITRRLQEAGVTFTSASMDRVVKKSAELEAEPSLPTFKDLVEYELGSLVTVPNAS